MCGERLRVRGLSSSLGSPHVKRVGQGIRDHLRMRVMKFSEACPIGRHVVLEANTTP